MRALFSAPGGVVASAQIRRPVGAGVPARKSSADSSETSWKQKSAHCSTVSLGVKEAESILSFCNAGKQAAVAIENGQCVVRLGSEGGPLRFEAPSFEDALKAAADGGHLRRSCIDKQIAFWGRHAERPKDAISRVLMSELGAARGRIARARDHRARRAAALRTDAVRDG